MPTRAGWGLLVVGPAFIVAGRLFGAIEFLVVGVAAFSAPILALQPEKPNNFNVRAAPTRPKCAH